jgi:hypothetical protein
MHDLNIGVIVDTTRRLMSHLNDYVLAGNIPDLGDILDDIRRESTALQLLIANWQSENPTSEYDQQLLKLSEGLNRISGGLHRTELAQQQRVVHGYSTILQGFSLLMTRHSILLWEMEPDEPAN